VSNIKVALVWAICGAIATIALFPYVSALFPGAFVKAAVPFPVVIGAQLVEATILVFVLCWVGLICGTSLGLDSSVVRSWLNSGGFAIIPRRLGIGTLLGCAVALVLLAAAWASQRYMPAPFSSLPVVALWKRLLAAPYGGIVEECVCRLFLVSLIAWLLAKGLRHGRVRLLPTPWVFWMAIVVASLLFGIGHLPAVARLWPLTTVVVLRTVVLNAVGGFLFGWLFWRWGFEYAVIAHFSCDIILHGFGSG
jgi:Type II CAAX prenyl endopeptidase Rce1-like